MPGTHDPGAGWRFREGIHPVINDSLVISSFGANDQASGDDNYCLRIDNVETAEAAINGDLQLNSVIFSCQENVKGNAIADRNAVVAFADERAFAEAEGNQFATVADGTVVESLFAPLGHEHRRYRGAACDHRADERHGDRHPRRRLGNRRLDPAVGVRHRPGQSRPGSVVRVKQLTTA